MKCSELSCPELFAYCARRGDAAFWEEFIKRFNPVIAGTLVREALKHGAADRTLIDDLVQETYLKICADECKLLRMFTPQTPDSAFGFLKVVAASVARDFFKSRLAEKRAPEATASSVEEIQNLAPKSTRGMLSSAERTVLLDQIDCNLRALVPPEELQRARAVFWLYYRSGLTASAIASLPTINLTTKGVESLLLRLTRLVRQKLSTAREPNTSSREGIPQPESF